MQCKLNRSTREKQGLQARFCISVNVSTSTNQPVYEKVEVILWADRNSTTRAINTVNIIPIGDVPYNQTVRVLTEIRNNIPDIIKSLPDLNLPNFTSKKVGF